MAHCFTQLSEPFENKRGCFALHLNIILNKGEKHLFFFTWLYSLFHRNLTHSLLRQCWKLCLSVRLNLFELVTPGLPTLLPYYSPDTQTPWLYYDLGHRLRELVSLVSTLKIHFKRIPMIIQSFKQHNSELNRYEYDYLPNWGLLFRYDPFCYSPQMLSLTFLPSPLLLSSFQDTFVNKCLFI